MKKIRVALETQFAVGTATGLGVYASQLVRALHKRDDVDVIELRDESLDPWRFDRRVWWDQSVAPRMARASRADVYHFTGGTLPWRMPHPTVLSLHDVAWLRGKAPGRFYARWYFGRWQAALAKRADALVADTVDAAREIAAALRIDPARIDIAGAAVDERFVTLERRPAQPPFALVVGTVEARKDLATAVRAAARVQGLHLVAAGPLTPYAADVRAAIAKNGVQDRVRLLGYVSDAELLDLYARAAVLVFPSHYEGFGLPPLQAIACGLPVVASRIGVVEEVLGDAARYAPPGDANAFAAAIEEVLAGGDTVQSRVRRGIARASSWSWSTVAETMMGIYRRLAS